MSVRISRNRIAQEIQNVAQTSEREEATYQGPRRVSDSDVQVTLPLGRSVPFPVAQRVAFTKGETHTGTLTAVIELLDEGDFGSAVPPNTRGRLRSLNIYTENRDTNDLVLLTYTLQVGVKQAGEAPPTVGPQTPLVWTKQYYPIPGAAVGQFNVFNVPTSSLAQAMDYIWYPGEVPTLLVKGSNGSDQISFVKGIFEFTPAPFVPTHQI